MTPETIRRVVLARHMYDLAMTSLRSANDLHLFTAANLLQDSAEAFLLAVANHVNAAIGHKAEFLQYFDKIDDRIAPARLPFRPALDTLNKIRIASKHHGIQPQRSDCERLAITLREFLGEVSEAHLGVNFSTVSTLELLTHGAAKEMLQAARDALDVGDFWGCSVACRKALFLEIEKDYDVRKFQKNRPKNLGILEGLNWVTAAPAYAQSQQYVSERVRSPTDFIVFDHSRLDQDLVQAGIDPTAFWNLWRLTPEVYQTENQDWVVKEDFSKRDEEFLGSSINYIFSTSVDIILPLHNSRKAARHTSYSYYFVELNRDLVDVYEKADKQSAVKFVTPAGSNSFHCDHRVQGLLGDAMYYYIFHMKDGVFIVGYVHEEHVRQVARVL